MSVLTAIVLTAAIGILVAGVLRTDQLPGYGVGSAGPEPILTR